MTDEPRRGTGGGLVPAERRDLAGRSASLVRRGLEALEHKERVLRFPADRSLGTLFGRAPGHGAADWREVGQAQGPISIASGQELLLVVGPGDEDGLFDISPLAGLDPGDLYDLTLWVAGGDLASGAREVGEPGEGPSYLTIWGPQIGHGGIAQLHGLTRLRHLRLQTTEDLFPLFWDNHPLLLWAPHLREADLERYAALAGVEDLALLTSKIGDDGLAYLHELPTLESLDLAGTSFGDEGLAHLRGLPGLRRLSLRRTQIKGPGLAHLQTLPRLETLHVSATPLDDEGLAHLRGPPGLRRLSLRRTQIKGPGLAHLQTLPRLEALDVVATPLGDEGLAHLQGLPGLRRLSLASTSVTDAGLMRLRTLAGLESLTLSETPVRLRALVRLLTGSSLTWRDSLALLGHISSDLRHLAETNGWPLITDAGLTGLRWLTGLRRLTLRRIPITDAGLAHLRGLTGLRYLTLADTLIGDGGLVQLRGLTGLRRLILRGTRVTDAGLADLSRALPSCRIVTLQ